MQTARVCRCVRCVRCVRVRVCGRTWSIAGRGFCGGCTGTSSLCAVLCTHPIPLVALVRATSGLLLFGMFDVVPLWLAASRGAGGLALNEKQLGMTLALASLVMLPWVLQPMGR